LAGDVRPAVSLECLLRDGDRAEHTGIGSHGQRLDHAVGQQLAGDR
jgi:hypothetical protein